MTPYYVVKNGEVTDRVKYLLPGDEAKHCITDFNALDESGKKIREGDILARKLLVRGKGEPSTLETLYVSHKEVTLIDVSPMQLISPATALVPFIQHCDGHRALMGTSMQKQAVPLITTEAPLVGTGMERVIAMGSSHVVRAEFDGTVEMVDASRILTRRTEGMNIVDSYKLKKFKPSNQGTCINQKPVVRVGDKVKKGDLLADGPAISNGELSLGRNMLVAYMSWGGYGYEDSIIISERLVREDTFSSIHIKSFEIDELKTRLGSEIITKEVPNVSRQLLAKLDDNGIIKIGSSVKPGDYLVGKVTPKGEDNLGAEEALLRAIFGNTPCQMTDSSLVVPPASGGVVVDVHILDRKKDRKGKSDTGIKEQNEIKTARDEEIDIARANAGKVLQRILIKHKDILVYADGSVFDGDIFKKGPNALAELDMNNVSTAPDEVKEKVRTILVEYRKQLDLIDRLYRDHKVEVRAADELPEGVIKRITVTIAMKKKLMIGDKMAGRYGNKGVVSCILPVEDMPFLEDGTPVDIVLNPLGVPSRMNIGQLLETQFGMTSWVLGNKLNDRLEKDGDLGEIRGILKRLYDSPEQQKTIDAMQDGDLKQIVKKLKDGIPIATPVFAGANEADIISMMEKAGVSSSAKYKLYDGRTGEPFDQDVFVGIIYIMKLYHLVEDKIHARSIGPYSAITQQPLKGRAKNGGQRIGEMEAWAIEGYGAAYNLLEMMTIKSDDMEGRVNAFEKIVEKGHYHLGAARTEALSVLCRELNGLCLDVEFVRNGYLAKNNTDKENEAQKNV